MYSCVCWCEFIDLVGFFGCFSAVIVWLLSLFVYEESDRGHTIKQTKKTTKSMNSHQQTQEYIKGTTHFLREKPWGRGWNRRIFHGEDWTYNHEFSVNWDLIGPLEWRTVRVLRFEIFLELNDFLHLALVCIGLRYRLHLPLGNL